MDIHEAVNDTWKSKKLWFAAGCIACSFIFAVLASTCVPQMDHLYSDFNGILEFLAGAYLTGNVANKFVQGKIAEVKMTSEKAEEEDVIPGIPLAK